MKIVLNDRADSPSLKKALTELARGAETLSLAVSYLQVGGWELFQRHTSGLSLAKMRIVCTDQMGITQPAAVRRAIDCGVQIRNFAGDVTYHPKVYLAHGRGGLPTRFLIASANMSYSAFTDSVEAGFLGRDAASLRKLGNWFNDLFQNQSEEFTPERLRLMDEKWRAAATRRTRARLRVRREMVIPQITRPTPLEAEDLDALEDVFATVQLPIGLLNMDYAGNNIRNVGRVREVLADWNAARTSTSPAGGKQRNELKLLGFAEGRQLTALGQAAAVASSREEVARQWCAWLQRTADAELASINEGLLVAKRVFAQFWRLDSDVQNYFLEHAEQPSDTERPTLQIIELLCNASAVVNEFSLEDMRTLAPLLRQPHRLPAFVRGAVLDYQDNKGTRGWDYPDRRIMPLAWQESENEGAL
jgi:HKD family nuclease